MACKLCNNLPLGDVESLNRDVSLGIISLEVLAERYEISKKRLRLHIRKCLGGESQTGHTVLNKSLRDLKTLAKELKEDYDRISEKCENEENVGDEELEVSRGYVLSRYLNVRQEMRETVMAMERIKPSEEIAKEILASVMSPLIVQIINVSTQELKNLRTELRAIAPEGSYMKIDAAIKEALLNIGHRLTHEREQIAPNLRRILNTRGSKKKLPILSLTPSGKGAIH